ncbi:hypothetical protein [Vibrio alginolyticus]|uniref:hypothetical protein n=1 Tax=Vibrio alginolyticus TaxID=663 RepID=UPI0006CA8F44|nr:hypothetical protein [Vibrio alginolyticus]KPM98501.1 hypothetical protein AOG25_08640 [Vibrio alginolyticus]CAH7145914.1 conserved hypothetical protein [Vibrio chagasii]CAH7316920.1 conserved hypothetical protein [Vibrio chagasii]
MQNSIILSVKHLLNSDASKMSIKIFMYLAERSHNEVIYLTPETKGFKDLTTEDISDFYTSSTDMFSATRLIDEPCGEDFHAFEVTTKHFGKMVLATPKKIGRKQTVKKSDSDKVLESQISEIFEFWLKYIGTRKDLYSRLPSLTKSTTGRYHAIKRALKKGVCTVEEAKAAIFGAIHCLSTMGYDPKTGEKKPKHYAELVNILRNRQNVESNMNREKSCGTYIEQLEALNEKHSVRKIGLSKGTDSKGETDDDFANNFFGDN